MTFDDYVQSELRALTRFSGAVAGDEHLAQDILSDTLLKVAARWSRISKMTSPDAYVRRVLVTTYLSDRRKTLRRRTDPTDNLSLLDRSSPDASELVVRRDEINRLLACLTARQRVVIVLRYLFDQDDQQISEVLDCSAATVRSHLSHARATLRLTGSIPADRT